MNIIRLIYRKLLAFHGRQGWWPIVNNETRAGEYHVGAPRGDDDFFEIAVGAILTQNISWNNVDRALGTLKQKKLLNPPSLEMIDNETLAGLIRPTGYYNQKAQKLKNFTAWFRGYDYQYGMLAARGTDELRRELLEIKGVGPETADSILLYALGREIFVVDAYTKRLFTRIGFLSGNESYRQIQELFHQNFKSTADSYNEYHALIVAHGKDYCKKKPFCPECCLNSACEKKI
jgi:endonuclease III related protein